MNNELEQIADLLGEVYGRIAETKIAISDAEYWLEARAVAMQPVGGWPGGNKEQQAAAQKKALAEDEQAAKFAEAIRQGKATLERLQGDEKRLEAQRRSLEWCIRAMQVNFLIPEAQPDHIIGITQQVSDKQNWNKIAEQAPENPGVPANRVASPAKPDDDNIPF